jgi:23S rRNA (adenine2503-C2)-methyltransferase
MKQSLLQFDKKTLESSFIDRGIKSFVANQVLDWIYKKKKTAFSEMRNISGLNKDILEKYYLISPISNVSAISSEEHAVKFVGTLLDKLTVEFVVLKQDGYNTLCVSSQCGCPVDCKFCLTGVAGFKRNLTTDEIVAQILHAESAGYPIRNLVFMGMGEPLLNYNNVRNAISILTSDWGFDISNRKYTISTSGFKKTIQKLMDDEWFVNLAFSVGSADPIVRERIMPVERSNPIVEVSRLIKHYQSMHNRKLTLEYTLLKGVNDSKKQIDGLINLAKYLNAKINLINLNPHSKIPFEPVSSITLKSIMTYIKSASLSVTVRYRKGQDIAAACGQLGESILTQ